MPTIRRSWSLLILAGLLALAPAVRAQETFYRPELTAKYLESSVRTDWYGVYFKNQKIGYVRDERKRIGDRFVEEQFMSMKLLSFGNKAELSSLQTATFEAAAPHRMVSTVLVEK